MQTEYISSCKSISLFDLRLASKKLAREIALPLNSFRTSVLCFVASGCNNIARCILPTVLIRVGRAYKHNGGVRQFLPLMNNVGILAEI